MNECNEKKRGMKIKRQTIVFHFGIIVRFIHFYRFTISSVASLWPFCHCRKPLIRSTFSESADCLLYICEQCIAYPRGIIITILEIANQFRFGWRRGYQKRCFCGFIL